MTFRARAIVIAFLAYTAAAIAYTWPLAARLDGVPHDRADPLLTTWFLWWSGTQAVPLTAHWWNAPMFVPAPGAFAFSEHLLGLTPIATPFTLITGQPLVGHNIAFIATYALGALAAHFLAWTLTKRHDVSAIAAVAFAFAPYRLPQAPHIQVLASFWTPVCLGALHCYAQTWRTRWIVLASGAWVLQGLCCGYFTFFLAVLVALWFLWFAAGLWPVRRLATAAAAFAAGAIVIAPFLLGYQTILRGTYGFKRSIGEMRAFSADVASLLSAGEDLLVWSWVRVFERPEANLFPGLTIVLLVGLALRAARPFSSGEPDPRWIAMVRRTLAVILILLLAASALPFAFGSWQLAIGGIRLVSIARGDKPLSVALAVALALLAFLPGVRAAFRRRSAAAFYLLAAILTWIFTLGPDPTIMDHRLLYRAPYSWLMLLPGFDGLRVPARFWTMTLACLAVTGALAVHRLEGSTRRIVVTLAILGLLIDGWPKRFTVVDAPPVRPSPADAALRLDLPITELGDPQTLYQQMFDPKPLVNGFSGFTPPHYGAMKALLDEGDPEILRILASRGPLGVVVDHAADAGGAQRAMVAAFQGTKTVQSERDWSSYLIPRGEAPAGPPDVSGSPVRIRAATASSEKAPAARAIDGNLDTAWSAAKDTPGIAFTIELEESTHVAQLVLALGQYAGDLPGRVRIDVSPDGSRWDTVWSGSAALPTYYAAMRHAREVPVVFPIGRDNVRSIRIEQPAASRHDWSIAEVRVLR
jgi:F5/8 type C domain